MRPGQQNNNKRMRGRGRKGPNPLSRSYESNGPDVKIRGTAQHIAERYTTLARDATSAGDRVMAENYFQHAEHYGRIVAAAQGSFQPAQIERDYDETDEDGEGGEEFANAPRQDERNGNNGNNGQYRERNDSQYRDRNDGQPRGDQQPRERRDDNREFRGDRQDRENGRDHRGERENGRDQRDNRADRDNRPPREGRENRDRNFRDRRDQNGQPHARDRNEGGEDRPQRGERRFENRERRDENDGPRANAEDDFAPAAEAAAPMDAPRSGEPQGLDEAPVRRRTRTPRPRLHETSGEEPVNAEIPSNAGESAATVSADSAAAEEVAAPRRRGRPPRKVEGAEEAAPQSGAEAGVQADAEAPVKRKPGRPRKVKAEDEGGEGADRSDLPAFLLASNG